MCSVSMVTDWGLGTWPQRGVWENEPNKSVQPNGYPHNYTISTNVKQEDFDAFKREFLEFKELVKKALKYDEENNEPHCEVDDKVALVRKVAEQLGVSVDDIFPTK